METEALSWLKWSSGLDGCSGGSSRKGGKYHNMVNIIVILPETSPSTMKTAVEKIISRDSQTCP
jgi:hypothetical protein